MACNDLCCPCGPAPLANSCNAPCVRQCEGAQGVPVSSGGFGYGLGYGFGGLGCYGSRRACYPC
ncbi:PREDICTED: feather keratin-like [Nestor notabilis]|uniref:feather keratin-like n=1 Tax=Nestor notabilis TaxID=176057 RepID=UPI000523B316|nr:PREDICTED: feather keratin-like [Nestor notabilis]